MVGHRRQPDVGIEADLMTGMPGDHRPAARLRHVAHQEAVPVARLVDLGGEFLQDPDKRRVTPIAIAGEPHHLPCRAIDRKRGAARKAAIGVEPDHMAVPLRRDSDTAEKLFRWRLGIILMLKGRERVRLDRSLILRRGAGGGEECQEDGVAFQTSPHRIDL